MVLLGEQSRRLFDIPEGVTYLNCAYLSPQLRSVTEAGLKSVRTKASPWEVKPEDFFEVSERLRGLFARLVGARAEDVALVPSVSYGVGVAAANVPVEAGQNVVLLDRQFPSNVYPWREAVRRGAGRIVTAGWRDDGWTSSVLECVDKKTAAVAIPACHWTDGTLVDLVQVGRRCREVGAALVLDLTQSLGAMPFDMAEVRPDFVVAAAYKWLLGPYSLAYMAVSPRWHSARPLEHNWITRQDSDDFSRLVEYRDGFAPGARRFDVGQRSNFVLLPMAAAALEQLLGWGVEEVATSIDTLTSLARRRARGLGLTVLEPHARHLAGVRFPEGVPTDLAQRLKDEQISVSLRGDSLRISPHVYNTADDIQRLFDVLEASAGST